MSSHFEGHTVGKDRCDAFLASLQEIDPGVERDIGRNSCSFRIGGQAALCHVYHLKTRSDLTVWVRSASISDEGAHGFEIRRRESTVRAGQSVSQRNSSSLRMRLSMMRLY